MSNFIMLRALTMLAVLHALPQARAQAAGSAPGLPQTQIQVNFLNTCRPPQADLEEMGRALSTVKDRPVFSADFEISRGLTTLNAAEARAVGASTGSTATSSTWVRIRKEFPEEAILTNAQYSLSVEGGSISEVLALHLREGRAVLQVLISDSVKGSPAQAVRADTPPDRIRIERFGKASIVLARCGGINQSKGEPMFLAASEILRNYRVAMKVKSVVLAESVRLPGGKESKSAPANH